MNALWVFWISFKLSFVRVLVIIEYIGMTPITTFKRVILLAKDKWSPFQTINFSLTWSIIYWYYFLLRFMIFKGIPKYLTKSLVFLKLDAWESCFQIRFAVLLKKILVLSLLICWLEVSQKFLRISLTQSICSPIAFPNNNKSPTNIRWEIMGTII